jgi:hypothetical protein
MKIRQGFVSNSSSTSFYIDASKYSCAKVKETIKLALDLVNFCHDSNYGNIDSICTVHETKDIKGIEMQIQQHYAPLDDSLFDDDNLANQHQVKLPKKVIVVDSTDDNSIPFSIQEFLENELGATRQHWG